MFRPIFGFLLVTTTLACGGALSPSEPSSGDPSPGDPSASSEPSVETGPKEPNEVPAQSGNALEHFHRGSAKMTIDHQRALVALHDHTPGSDASYRACAKLSGTLEAGTQLELATELYPTTTGGAIAVADIHVKRLDTDGLVLHLTMKNGTELDDTWQRGLGARCEGDCVPQLETCRE